MGYKYKTFIDDLGIHMQLKSNLTEDTGFNSLRPSDAYMRH